VPSSPFSPRSPCGTGQRAPAGGRKAQVTGIPLLPTSPLTSSQPWCPTAPGPATPLAPRYLLPTQPGLPWSACSARLALLPRLPWVTLGRGGRGNRSGQSSGSTGAAGGRRGSARPPPLPRVASLHGLQGQPLQSPTDGRMDGQTDGGMERGIMPSAATLPLGRSCP